MSTYSTVSSSLRTAAHRPLRSTVEKRYTSRYSIRNGYPRYWHRPCIPPIRHLGRNGCTPSGPVQPYTAEISSIVESKRQRPPKGRRRKATDLTLEGERRKGERAKSKAEGRRAKGENPRTVHTDPLSIFAFHASPLPDMVAGLPMYGSRFGSLTCSGLAGRRERMHTNVCWRDPALGAAVAAYSRAAGLPQQLPTPLTDVAAPARPETQL